MSFRSLSILFVLILSALTSFPVVVLAQPVLDGSFLPRPGDVRQVTVRFYLSTNGQTVEIIEDANQIWDFSLIADSPDSTTTITSDSFAVNDETMFIDYFRGGTVVSIQRTSPTYSFIQDINGRIFNLGEVIGERIERFRQPRLEFQLPARFGDSWGGDYELVLLEVGDPIQSGDLLERGSIQTEYAGYGTLIVPGGDRFEDVVLLKITTDFITREASGQAKGRQTHVAYQFFTAPSAGRARLVAFTAADITGASRLSVYDTQILDEAPAAFRDSRAVSGIWFDPANPGDGFILVRADEGLVIFFFGYDDAGNQMWLVSDTITGDFGSEDPIEVAMFTGSGGSLQSPGPDVEQWGTAIVAFSECDAAQITLIAPNGDVIKSVIRGSAVAGITECD